MTERRQWLQDVFVTALEGGIGYWSECEEYHWDVDLDDPTDGFFAVVYDIEDENARYVITEGTIDLGLERLREGKVGLGAYLLGPLMVADLTNGQEGDIDADGADAVVQAGLFGELVYG